MSQLRHTCGQLLVMAASGSPTLAPSLCPINIHWWTARENGAQVRSSFVMRAHLYENISPLQSSGGTETKLLVVVYLSSKGRGRGSVVELAPSRQAALGSIPNTAEEHHPSTPVKFSCNWVCFTFPSYSGSPTRLSPSPTEGRSGGCLLGQAE